MKMLNGLALCTTQLQAQPKTKNSIKPATHCVGNAPSSILMALLCLLLACSQEHSKYGSRDAHLHRVQLNQHKVQPELREPLDRCQDQEEAPDRECDHSKQREHVVQCTEHAVQQWVQWRADQDVHHDVNNPADGHDDEEDPDDE